MQESFSKTVLSRAFCFSRSHWVGLFTIPSALFLAYHACGTIAPFRDAGEFAVAAAHLSVAHPPGYPFYILLSRVWATMIPWGTLTYRLNILSALASGLVVPLAVFWLTRYFGVSRWAAFVASFIFVFSQPLLSLSFVSEMYTVGMVFLLVLLIGVEESFAGEGPRGHYFFLASFLFALALGIRMDLALSGVYVAPFLASLLRERPWQAWKRFCGWILFFLLGVSVFLYLFIRSQAPPMVNWGDPSTLAAFLRSVTRSSYGSAVDLLSRAYRPGELFWDDLRHYGKILWRGFGPLALLAPIGVYVLARRGKLLPSLLCWLANVPVFLYLANMPPNPHALKILEDHFLPSLLMMVLWIAIGLETFFTAIFKKQNFAASSLFLRGFLVAGVILSARYRVRISSQRGNFYAYDYVRNLFLSAPLNATLVMHEDVQLFSSWEAQRVRKKRRDLRLVAQGLSGSPWYQKNLREHWGYADLVLSKKLETPQAWEGVVAANASRAFTVGFETDLQTPIEKIPAGLTWRLCKSPVPGCLENRSWLWSFFVFRGSYRYEAEPLFFNQDLIEDYAKALEAAGWSALRLNHPEQAQEFWRRALAMKRLASGPYLGLAYLAFQKGQAAEAAQLWQLSREKSLEVLALAARYRSLPGVVSAINAELAQTLVSLGVCAEKLGRSSSDIIVFYQEATQRDPNNPQAHNNLAACYWKMGDWANAKREFQQVLRLDPANAQAQKYLSQLH